MNIKSDILTKAQETMSKYPQLRLGQAVFNAAYELFPEATNALRGSDFDCFYAQDHSKVDAFLSELEELI